MYTIHTTAIHHLFNIGLLMYLTVFLRWHFLWGDCVRLSPALFENCGNCRGRDAHGLKGVWIGFCFFLQCWSQSEEDFSGQVQFHGFSQFLWFKPGTVAWSGAVSDIRVAGRDISCQSDFEKNKVHYERLTIFLIWINLFWPHIFPHCLSAQKHKLKMAIEMFILYRGKNSHETHDGKRRVIES